MRRRFGDRAGAVLDRHYQAPDRADAHSACQPIESVAELHLSHELLLCALRNAACGTAVCCILCRSATKTSSVTAGLLGDIHFWIGRNDSDSKTATRAL